MHLDRFVPNPRLREVTHVDVGAPLARAHDVVRHFDLASSRLVRALFSLRTAPGRLRGRAEAIESLRFDDIGRPGTGFHILVDDETSFVVGSIGRFWESEIPFRDVPAAELGAFEEPGWGKLAWEVRFEARGEHATRITFELRVSAADDETWQRFRRYFALIGPFSRFIRRHVFELIVRELGTPEAEELERELPGDDCVPFAKGQVTQGVTIRAKPEAIWPWLVQMGCGRAGWYSYDLLDNGGKPSARRILPEFQNLCVGDELAASPNGSEGFTVERIDPERCLLLHILVDLQAERRVPPGEPCPDQFLEVSWAFVLEPIDGETTRLIVRTRADLEPERAFLRIFRGQILHRFMEARQLENIRRLAEGTMPKHVNTLRDVGEGLLGAFGMLVDLGTPFLRGSRSHWGLTQAEAERVYPGDESVPRPSWAWTHAIEIDASAEDVWPWVVQMGQDKAGFYSYQWLENLVGCDIQNGDSIRRDWQTLSVGEAFRLHPDMPPLTIAAVAPGRHFVATSESDPARAKDAAHRPSESSVKVSWAFFVETLPMGRCRFISRYRIAYGDDLWTRLAYGPYVLESLGFMMDRGMLAGVKRRAEQRRADLTQTGRPSS